MDGNDPAFPQPIDDMGTMTCVTAGMSIRAWLAGKAMQGILQLESGYGSDKRHHEFVAEYAVKYADALIAALNKEEP